MIPRILLALTLLASLTLAAEKPPTQPTGLRNPSKFNLAMQLVSASENSSLDWKAQYAYIEYNVEKDPKENRGYTAGIIGFASRTGDMLDVVRRYQELSPGNKLTPFIGALERANGKPTKNGLGKLFEAAWKAAAADPKFRQAQDEERDRTYFNPAIDQAITDGLHELGQFIYYDAIIMHGPGEDHGSFGGIRATAIKTAKPPAQGGDEKTYLNAFLDARKAAMKAEQGHQDTTRIDTMQRPFLTAGNLTLTPPLEFKVYDETYKIPK